MYAWMAFGIPAQGSALSDAEAREYIENKLEEFEEAEEEQRRETKEGFNGAEGKTEEGIADEDENKINGTADENDEYGTISIVCGEPVYNTEESIKEDAAAEGIDKEYGDETDADEGTKTDGSEETAASRMEEDIEPDPVVEALKWAFSKLGAPYSRERRNSGTAFDCSSFVKAAYLNADIDISYGGLDTSYGIAQDPSSRGKKIKKNELQPGDLIFYSYGKGIAHVAMYIGDRLEIEASSKKQEIVIQDLILENAVMFCRPV